jgi:hypothetical protein
MGYRLTYTQITPEHFVNDITGEEFKVGQTVCVKHIDKIWKETLVTNILQFLVLKNGHFVGAVNNILDGRQITYDNIYADLGVCCENLNNIRHSKFFKENKSKYYILI